MKVEPSMMTTEIERPAQKKAADGKKTTGAEKPMRVLILDDHALFRQGLRMLLRDLYPGADIVEASNATEALAAAKKNTDFQLVLVDLKLPGGTGFSTLKKLSSTLAKAAIAVVSASDNITDITESYKAGAKGFIAKSSTADVLRHALPLILSGETYIPSSATAALVSGRRETAGGGASEAIAAAPSLTPRQREILVLMAHGLQNRDIAERLGMLEGTVKVHVKGVLQKLGVKNRTHAVIKGFRLGLVPISIIGPDAEE